MGMRGKRWLMLVGIGAAVTMAATAADPARLAIAGIGVGSFEKDVVRKLGKPRSRTTEEGYIMATLHYDRSAYFLDEDDRVVGMRSSNPRSCFERVVCPGMPLSEARKHLSRMLPGPTHDPKGLAFGDPRDSGCWVELTPEGKTLASLAIKCQP